MAAARGGGGRADLFLCLMLVTERDATRATRGNTVTVALQLLCCFLAHTRGSTVTRNLKISLRMAASRPLALARASPALYLHRLLATPASARTPPACNFLPPPGLCSCAACCGLAAALYPRCPPSTNLIVVALMLPSTLADVCEGPQRPQRRDRLHRGDLRSPCGL